MAKLNAIDYDEKLYAPQAEEGSRILANFSVKKDNAPAGVECEFLTGPQIIAVHDRLIGAYGGETGVRVHGAIDAYLDRAMNSKLFGMDPYPTIFEKAAYVFRSICAEHPFVDGQKRTGLATAFILLGLNGYALWSRHQMDEVHYAIHVAQGKKEVEEIAAWLQARVGPLAIGKGNASIVSMLGGRSGPSSQPRCRHCGRFLSLSGRHAACLVCKIVYEVTARAVAFAAGANKQNIEAKIGLHKVGDDVQIHKQANGNRAVVFRVTARDEHERFVSMIRNQPANNGVVLPERNKLRIVLMFPPVGQKTLAVETTLRSAAGSLPRPLA